MEKIDRGLLVLIQIWTFLLTTVAGAPVNTTLGEPYRAGAISTAKAKPAINTTYNYSDHMKYNSGIEVTDSNMSQPASNTCVLRPKNETEMQKITDILQNGMKMIRYNLIKDGDHEYMLAKSHLFKPFSWVKVTGRQGAGLLLLKDHFDILSLFTLRIGVTELDVHLTESPENCLKVMDAGDAETLLRETVMNGFYSTTVGDILKLQESDQVCNMHVENNEGYAEFRHYCCKRNAQGNFTCQYLQEGFWMNILLYAIAALKILVLLFSPRFVPGSVYRLKDTAKHYVHNLADNIKLSLNVELTKKPASSKEKNTFKLSEFKHMPKFMETIEILKQNPGVSHTLELKAIHLSVDPERLIPEKSVPIGLFSKLYETFVMCQLRKKSAFKPCCDSNICQNSQCNAFFTWYSLMRRIMTMIMLSALITPWILRVALYFSYEHQELDMRRQAADNWNLKLPYSGSYVLYLTPLHIIFIIIYVLLSLEFCIYGVVSKGVQEKLKFVLRWCFRDMREKNHGGVMTWAFRFALRPCTKYGGFGLCIGIVAWVVGLPFMAVFLALWFLPTLNITVRLFVHFFEYLLPREAYKFCIRFCEKVEDCVDSLCISEKTGSESQEKNKKNCKSCEGTDSESPEEKERILKSSEVTDLESRAENKRILKSRRDKSKKYAKNSLPQLVIILFCIISLYSVLFLLIEIIDVVVEILVYTLMGVILNASKILSYVSLLLLLAVYAKDCFGHVNEKFLAFNKILNGAVVSLGEKECEAVMYKSYDNQENMAFMLNTERSSDLEDPVKLTRDAEGHPMWSVGRLALLFSRDDIPYITKSLFSKACNMRGFSFVPGDVLYNYMRAALEFGIIMIFLIFVFLVIFAFGDTYKISVSNQLLASVAGGLLPLLVKKLFKEHTVPEIKDDSVRFKIYMHELLEDFKQDWPIHDIIVKDGETAISVDTVSDGSRASVSHAVKSDGIVNGERERNFDSVREFWQNEAFSSPGNETLEKETQTEDIKRAQCLSKLSFDMLVDMRKSRSDDFP